MTSCWTGRSGRADGLRRLHRVRPGADVHRGLHPRPACCRCTPTPTPRRRPPAAGRPRCARTRGGIIHARSTAARTTWWCSAAPARPARSTSSSGCSSSIVRRAAGRLHRPVRAPLQRAAVARVGRRGRHDPRGRRRPRRPRPPRARAAAPRGPAAEDRQLLRRVERDRDRHRRRRRSRSRCTATARCRAGTTPRPARTCRST